MTTKKIDVILQGTELTYNVNGRNLGEVYKVVKTDSYLTDLTGKVDGKETVFTAHTDDLLDAINMGLYIHE